MKHEKFYSVIDAGDGHSIDFSPYTFAVYKIWAHGKRSQNNGGYWLSYRKITKEEKKRMIRCAISFHRGMGRLFYIPYLLLKASILLMTKSVYPQQGGKGSEENVLYTSHEHGSVTR